jgi:mannose-6-phosphate isomerase-like protein (cupin superfamily)
MDEKIAPRPFRYAKPEFHHGKQLVRLARTDRMIAMIQVLKEGGENNLHSHRHLDGFWMVLKGRVRFYGEEDKLLADLGQHEGILIPRGSLYWFESSGDEDLELLQVEASDISLPTERSMREDRVDFKPVKKSIAEIVVHDARER